MARIPLIPATDHQKAQVLDLLQKGQSSRQIAQDTGLDVSQISALKAHLTRGTYSTDIADTQEVAEAMNATIGLERDLQRALRANIGQIESGLKIIDGGKEMTVSSGRIDIMAEDSAGLAVVIELKVGTAERDAIAQILSYIGDLGEISRAARGIVVAGDFAQPAISAARAAGRIKLLKYAFKFSFETIEL